MFSIIKQHGILDYMIASPVSFSIPFSWPTYKNLCYIHHLTTYHLLFEEILHNTWRNCPWRRGK